jgi:hypothetical protein
MSKSTINILLISPFPPPMGGIAHWASMIYEYSLRRKDIQIQILNIAPAWRSIHSIGILRRSFGGGGQLIVDLVKLYAGKILM